MRIKITEGQYKSVKEAILESESNITLYHGSNHLINNFSTEFVGAEEAKDMEGVGIYFTTMREDAEQYGDYLYVVEIPSKSKFISDTNRSMKVSPSKIKKLIMQKKDWRYDAQNWAENPTVGLNLAIKSFYDYAETEKDVYLSVWYDFFRYQPQNYVNGMVKLGIDGLVINNPYRSSEFKSNDSSFKHFVLYNPNIIQIKEVYKNGEKI